MRIDHLALWTRQIEVLKDFYSTYFKAKAGDKYINRSKNFESYFLSFDSGCRLEIMQMPSIPEKLTSKIEQYLGLTHFAIAAGGKSKVISLTEELRNAGYQIIGEPRTTGDGYFESAVLDPDGNRIEITV